MLNLCRLIKVKNICKVKYSYINPFLLLSLCQIQTLLVLYSWKYKWRLPNLHKHWVVGCSWDYSSYYLKKDFIIILATITIKVQFSLSYLFIFFLLNWTSRYISLPLLTPNSSLEEQLGNTCKRIFSLLSVTSNLK